MMSQSTPCPECARLLAEIRRMNANHAELHAEWGRLRESNAALVKAHREVSDTLSAIRRTCFDAREKINLALASGVSRKF